MVCLYVAFGFVLFGLVWCLLVLLYIRLILLFWCPGGCLCFTWLWIDLGLLVWFVLIVFVCSLIVLVSLLTVLVWFVCLLHLIEVLVWFLVCWYLLIVLFGYCFVLFVVCLRVSCVYLCLVNAIGYLRCFDSVWLVVVVV